MILRHLCKPLVIYSVIFILISAPLYGQLLHDASSFEKEGKYEEAIDLYSQWLNENPENPIFRETLLKVASLFEDMDSSTNFLLNHVDSLSDSEAASVYGEIALQYEMTNHLSEAADYYRIASEYGDNLTHSYYLKYLSLIFESGNFPSQEEVDAILFRLNRPEDISKALIYKARVLHQENKIRQAIELLRQYNLSNLFSQMQFALWELLIADEQWENAESVREHMSYSFPDSVELLLIDQRIERIPRLSYLFSTKPMLEEDIKYIQVGVFSSSQNAENLKRELSMAGFKSFIHTDSGLKKVMILVHGEVEIELESLKNLGYEGFITEIQ